MENSPKVSIITACYNGEKFIDTYAVAILRQTYQNIEVIFVDDGSTDASADRIKIYAAEFQSKGIPFLYIYQENKGQAAATNAGLQHIQGKYFSLFDIDDIMDPSCIDHRVKFMESHPACGMVRSKIWKLYDGERKLKVKFCEPEEKYDERWIFEDLLANRMVLFPIFFLYRTAAFEQVYPKREIYESRYTQDIQVALPISYYFKCGLLNEYLGTYLFHEDSHSHCCRSAMEEFNLWNGWEDVWLHTIDAIKMENILKKKYRNQVKKRFLEIKQFYLLKAAWDSLTYIPQNFYHKTYVIFGAGEEGHMLWKMLCDKRLPVACYIDNSIEKQGKFIDNIEVLSLANQKFQQMQDVYILIAISRYREVIEQQLNEQELLLGTDYSFYKSFIFQTVGQILKWI